MGACVKANLIVALHQSGNAVKHPVLPIKNK